VQLKKVLELLLDVSCLQDVESRIFCFFEIFYCSGFASLEKVGLINLDPNFMAYVNFN